MLAGGDDLLGLIETLVVAALGGDRHDSGIVEHVARTVEPPHAGVWLSSMLQLAPPGRIRLEYAGELHARVAAQRQQLARGMAVFGAVLG